MIEYLLNVQNYLLEASSHREAQLGSTLQELAQWQAACKQRVSRLSPPPTEPTDRSILYYPSLCPVLIP
jgi:hypothetical protein